MFLFFLVSEASIDIEYRHEIPTQQTVLIQNQPSLGQVGLASSDTHNLMDGFAMV